MPFTQRLLAAVSSGDVDLVKATLSSRSGQDKICDKLRSIVSLNKAGVPDKPGTPDKLGTQISGIDFLPALTAACRLRDSAIGEVGPIDLMSPPMREFNSSNYRVVRALLDAGATCHVTPDDVIAQRTPLHAATSAGCADTVSLLLQNNADPNVADARGRTPLHIAVNKCDYETSRLLLCRGADPDRLDAQKLTALQVVSMYGHVELVRLLLEYQARVFHEGQTGPSAMHLAAWHGHVPLVDIFTRYVDVNIRAPCDGGVLKSPLHLAAERGHVETIQFLLDRFGADVDQLDSQNQTAAHCALSKRYDHTRMRKKDDFDRSVELLITRSIKINHQQNKDGDSALHLAARNGHSSAVELLLKKKADHRLQNSEYMAPLDCVPPHDLAMRQLFNKHGVTYTAPARPSTLTSPTSAQSPLAKKPPNKSASVPRATGKLMPAPRPPGQSGITTRPTGQSTCVFQSHEALFPQNEALPSSVYMTVINALAEMKAKPSAPLLLK